MTAQLSLDVGLRDAMTFGAFEPGCNGEAVATLTAMAGGGGEPFAWLWGGAATGKTHLLQAACHAAGDRAATWLPLGELHRSGPGLLENLERVDLLCLDDLDRVVPDRGWELALFTLFNAVREAGTRLVVAASSPPSAVDLSFPDLASRLSWGPAFRLQPLDDRERRSALVRRARLRGFDLHEDAAEHLLRHCRRDLPALMGVLDRIDRASLDAGRRVTLPFVREVVAGTPAGTEEEGTVVCRRCFVAGLVQGVWYRAATRAEALGLGVRGYARNLDDGRVEVVACGDLDAVDALCRWLRQGPRGARVDDLSCAAIDAGECRFEGFEIRG